MTKSKHLPSVERVRELLSYDPETGEIRWRVGRGGTSMGSLAGNITSRGYRKISFDARKLQAHRLAWLIHYGEDPGDLEIDHKNGNKSDNRIANLRLASRNQNECNRTKSTTNTSGYKGVSWHKHRRKWQAMIQHDGRPSHLGYFATPEEAHAAYVAAAEQLHGEFARSA